MDRAKVFKGIGISTGIAIGPVVVIRDEKVLVARCLLTDEALNIEVKKLDEAVKQTKKQLMSIKEKVAKEINLDHSFIFDAQLLMLEDEGYYGAIKKAILNEKINVEWAVEKINRKFLEAFGQINDEYLKERGHDVKDVSKRLLLNLGAGVITDLAKLQEPAIIVTDDLPPSNLSALEHDRILGFATEVGGRTSHVGLLARSLRLPAVVGLHRILDQIDTGDLAILDGEEAKLILNPSEILINEYKNKQKQLQKVERRLIKNKDLPAVTRDGFEITMLANIDLPSEVGSAFHFGAKGIGLFRSEFLFMQHPEKIIDEEEHYDIYSSLLKKTAPHPTTIRILDIGSDKLASGYSMDRELNPALGLRAIRLFLRDRAPIIAQLRGMLRASVHGNLQILIPFVSGITEIKQTIEIIEDLKSEMRAKKVAHNDNIKIGMMIEIPSAAIIADQLAKFVDFFSVGTNDLIQYTLAIDRANENVSYLYRPLHPAILKLLSLIITAGKKANIPVSVCGEVAADPISMIVLLGMEYPILSMNAAMIPYIKNIIRSMDQEYARRIVKKILFMTTAKETEEYILEQITMKFPAGFII